MLAAHEKNASLPTRWSECSLGGRARDYRLFGSPNGSALVLGTEEFFAITNRGFDCA